MKLILKLIFPILWFAITMVANCSLIFEPGGRSAISMIFLVFITAAINILTGIYISLVLGDHAEEDLKDLKEKKDD